MNFKFSRLFRRSSGHRKIEKAVPKAGTAHICHAGDSKPNCVKPQPRTIVFS